MDTPTVNDSLLTSTLLKTVLGDDVMQLLKCGICWEFYSTPVILPCGHTFCYNCLLEMGKHAKTNKHYIPLQDLQINCPNCRQPIFVVALMARQVTLNYPITSLLEALKTSKLPERKEIGTNTECRPEKEIKSDSDSDDDPPGYYDKSKIDDMVSDLDDLFKSFRFEQSVLTDCQDEVEKIRQSFTLGNTTADLNEHERLRNNRNRKRGRKKPRQTYDQYQAFSSMMPSLIVPSQQKQAPTREYGTQQINGTPRNIPYADPAIVSFAVGHDGKVVSRGPMSVNLMDFLHGTAGQ